LINQSAPEADLTPQRTPAPRVSVSQIVGGQAIEPVLGEAANIENFRVAFLTAFGTTERLVAEVLFGQLLNAFQTTPEKGIDSTTANAALALIHSIRPRDTIEAMLGIQLVITHVAAMEASRRALHPEQTAAGRIAYLNLSRKLMSLFTAQTDALNRHRGKGTTQKIVIERVLVAPGAQAVVGAIASGGRGDGR
jgi:hypothetical protein